MLSIECMLAPSVGTTQGAQKCRTVQHWASYRPNRRYRLGGLDSVFIVESALATWSSTLMCIITIYNAEMDDKAHPRNVLDAMGSTVCSSSNTFWPTGLGHLGAHNVVRCTWGR